MNANQDFDLLALLKLGNFNVRDVAETKSSMTLGEYFDLLSEFTGLLPKASEALTKFIGFIADETAVKWLSAISVLLVDVGCIGCSRYVAEIDSILDAYSGGDKKFAASRAKEISDDFAGLYTRTMATKKKNKIDLKADALDGYDLLPDYKFEPNLSLSLKNILQQLDAKETSRKLRVLIVDDSTVMLKTVSSVLSEQYKVFTLAKPAMLETLLQQITPELFLLDYKMPELSGFDLIPIIRSFKEHENTPIIFLTAGGTSETLSTAIMLGAADFIVKPLHPKILREKIANHIVRKKLF